MVKLKWRTVFFAATYTAFALFSTALNLGSQQIVGKMLAGRISEVLPASILCGTVAGFAAKYLLDKNFIFFDRSETHGAEARKFSLYAAFSVFTTLIFWGSEIGAYYVFGTTAAKYVGAALGLAVGYVIKFKLDRYYTFTDQRCAGVRS